NSRNTVLVGLPPDFFGLRLHAVDRVKHRDGAIEHAQRPLYFGGEIHVAGSINNVDANVTPGAGRCSGRAGDAALLLLLHPVHGGGAFVDLSDAVRPSGIEEDALSRSGLAGINVGHDANVPATRQWNCSGHSFLSFVLADFLFASDIYWGTHQKPAFSY